jgi:hypothetical protein
MGVVNGLGVFPSFDGLPQDEVMQKRVLCSWRIKGVICFCLGPEGTNIAQAARRWLRRMGIEAKSKVMLCETPEESLRQARLVVKPGILEVFWTCAVYVNESRFFFTNPDVLAFLFSEVMPLDCMQLATKPRLADEVVGGVFPKSWKIASHPSPKHLIEPLGLEIVLANSNAAAAQCCADEQTEACITTETAKKIHGLVSLHDFGSPPMVFFGGITPHGIGLLTEMYRLFQRDHQPWTAGFPETSRSAQT